MPKKRKMTFNIRNLFMKIFSITASTLFTVTSISIPIYAQTTEYSITSLVGKYKTQGRTTVKDGALMLDWSASGIIFKANCSGSVNITVEATRINTSANQGSYFTVIVDGVKQYDNLRVPQNTEDWESNSTNYPFHITKKGESTFTIASNLISGEHTFEIYKQSEALYSAFGIKSISLNGTFLSPPQNNDLYIEYVGDSITASYSNLVTGCGGQALYQEATNGWPYLTSKKLNSDWSLIARTGITATKGIGHSGTNSVSMPDVYPMERYFSDTQTKYSFDRKPDVIVVCLGTNDISSYQTVEGATTETVKQGFIDLISMLKKHNPQSKIVWIYGMMTSAANNLINTAINESGGFKNGIYSLALPQQSGGLHPGPENQIIYAEMLSDFIDKNIINPDNNYSGGYNPELVSPSASVVYYNFNEGQGNTVNTKTTISTYYPNTMDFSATINGAEWVDGFVGKALKFSASSHTLTLNKTSGYNQNSLGMVPTYDVFGGTTEYDFWVKFNTLPTTREQMILCRGGSSSIPWAIKATIDGKIAFCWKNQWVYSDILDWQTDEWYHINITNSNTGDVTIKRDSLIKGTGTVSTSYTGTNAVMYINGGNFFDNNNYFNGSIDELYLGAKGGSNDIRLRSKVSFAPQGNVYIKPQYIYYNQTATAPEITDDNGNKVEWYTDEKCENKYNFNTPVTTDLTLYSKTSRNIEVTPSASVIYYNFNEGQGNTVNTKSTISTYTSAMDYSATLSGNVEWVDGFVGNGIKFSSPTDSLTLNKTSGYNQNVIGMFPNSAFNGGAEYDFWVKFNTLPNEREQIILCREGYNNIPWAIKVTTEGKIAFCWKNDWIYSNPINWKSDEWYHIRITNSTQGDVIIMRDGQIYGSGTVTADYIRTNRLMYINGGLLYNENNYFDGVIDELYLGALGGGEEIRLRSKINFNTNGGNDINAMYYYTDETPDIPENPQKTGYIFSGWYSNSELTKMYDFNKNLTDDITLYAKWEKDASFGDFNGDNQTNSQDLTLLRKFLTESKTETSATFDINRDGKTNLKDLVKLKKFIADN